MREYWGDQANGKTLVVHENSQRIRNFPLPEGQELAAQYSPADLLKLVENEVGQQELLEHHLPLEITARAQIDSDFRSRLTGAPNIVLADAGFDPGDKIILIHENTDTVHHLALPESPSSLVQLVAMERHILLSMLAQTTKCCATGTCDIHCMSCHSAPGPHTAPPLTRHEAFPLRDLSVPDVRMSDAASPLQETRF